MNYIEMSEKHIANTYVKYPLVIKRGKNATCWDTDGKKYIDFTSGIGVNNLGFANEKVNERMITAIENFCHSSNLYYIPSTVELAKKMCELTNMEKVFFANTGAEANETAIKVARKYSYEKYKYDRAEILTLKNSFHGRTMATLSATGQDAYHKYYFPFVDKFSYTNANDIEDLHNSITNETCAIMIEVIQGEGGVNFLQKEYLEEIQKVCVDKDILFIIDEVQTGVGRTGYLYSYEKYGLTPDIVTSAKGLGNGMPVGAVLLGDKVKDVFTQGSHGSTFGGGNLASSAVLAVLETVCDSNFLNSVKEKGDYIKERLKDVKGIKEVYNSGLMVGIVLEKGIESKDVVETALKKGVMTATAKEKVRLLPPLTITYKELDMGLNKFIDAMEELV